MITINRAVWFSAVLATALVAEYGHANAADMSVPVYQAPPPVPYLPQPTCRCEAPVSWTGFYIGGQVGETSGILTGSNTLVIPGSSFTLADQGVEALSGTLLGARIGADYQFGNGPVVGVIAEANWLGGSSKWMDDFGRNDSFSERNIYDIRARFGMPVSNGNLLVYGTGGVASGKFDFATGYTPVIQGFSINKAGWVAGAGVEYRFSEHFSGFAEALHYDFGMISVTDKVDSLVSKDQLTNNAIVVGINARF
jgi:opacity protein-like surface antigen